jgi:hypothetical protein
MESHNINNEDDFQNMYYIYLKKNGIAGLIFDTIKREYWLDVEKRNRIDIFAKCKNREYFYELKDFRKLTANQVYYKLGDLFLQILRYKSVVNKNESYFEASILLPKSMPETMIEDIRLMFRARKIFFNVLTLEKISFLNMEEIYNLL